MKVKMVVQSTAANRMGIRHSVVWEGELEILREDTYIMKISLIGEGEPQPLADIPFSPAVGYYQWIPPMNNPNPDY